MPEIVLEQNALCNNVCVCLMFYKSDPCKFSLTDKDQAKTFGSSLYLMEIQH